MNESKDKYIDLIEKSAACRLLKRDAAGRTGHAYLLVSPDRMALDVLADLFLAACIGGDDAYRRVTAGTVADVLRLPEEGEKVLVRDIDYLTETAYITPAEGDRKFYVVSYGETMNEAAQNKLLKTLEEPPAVTNIIVKTASLDAMRPTVRSRCRVVELKSFSEQAIADALKKYYPADARLALAAAASRGSIAEAERLIADDGHVKLFEQTVDMLKSMRRSSEAAKYAGRILARKDDVADVIEYIEIVLRDCLAVQAGRPELAVYPSGLNDTRAIAADYTTEAILGIMPVLAAARARLKLNGNVAGTVDELLFAILEIKFKNAAAK